MCPFDFVHKILTCPKVSLYSFVKKWLLWNFELKREWLWLGIWVIYFDWMLNIIYSIVQKKIRNHSFVDSLGASIGI